MSSVYVVTEKDTNRDELMKLFNPIIVSKYTTSKSILRPSNPGLLDAWGRLIIDTESRLVSDHDHVVFDCGISDKVGLALMLGFALAKITSQRELGRISLINTDEVFKFINLVELENEVIVESLTNTELHDQVMDQYNPVGDLSTDISEVLGSKNGHIIHFDLDQRSISNLILLGFCYHRGHRISLTKSKYDPILSKVGLFTVKPEIVS